MTRPQPQPWSWICEFCFTTSDERELPAGWEFVWQSAVCGECRPKVKAAGGYGVVKGGAFAEGGWTADPRLPLRVVGSTKEGDA